MNDQHITGTLKNNNDKGFVFISRDDGEADVFIYRSAFDRTARGVPRRWQDPVNGARA